LLEFVLDDFLSVFIPDELLLKEFVDGGCSKEFVGIELKVKSLAKLSAVPKKEGVCG